jgi:hypothetical protein
MSGEQADPYAAYPSVGEELHQTMSADEIAERLSAYVSRDADPNDPSFVDYVLSRPADEITNRLQQTVEAWIAAGELPQVLTQYKVLKKCQREGFCIRRSIERLMCRAEECAPAASEQHGAEGYTLTTAAAIVVSTLQGIERLYPDQCPSTSENNAISAINRAFRKGKVISDGKGRDRRIDKATFHTWLREWERKITDEGERARKKAQPEKPKTRM